MKKLIHVCSIASCINILNGDSGLNCFVDGEKFNKEQELTGEGAEIYIEWNGHFKYTSMNEKFPLSPNILYIQPPWRAVIPFGTSKNNIKVVDFRIIAKTNINLIQFIWIIILKLKLMINPIFLEIA